MIHGALNSTLRIALCVQPPPFRCESDGAYLGRKNNNSNFNFLQKGFASVSDAAKFKILLCRFFLSIELIVC